MGVLEVGHDFDFLEDALLRLIFEGVEVDEFECEWFLFVGLYEEDLCAAAFSEGGDVFECAIGMVVDCFTKSINDLTHLKYNLNLHSS